jgi:hypothetical protein
MRLALCEATTRQVMPTVAFFHYVHCLEEDHARSIIAGQMQPQQVIAKSANALLVSKAAPLDTQEVRQAKAKWCLQNNREKEGERD